MEMGLEDFQESFVNSMLKNEFDEKFLRLIRPGGKLSSAMAVLNVHRRGYICRLTESLGEIFEGVWCVLGDELFIELCEEFIWDHPSHSYNLSNYGESFPYFLGTRKDLVSEFPFLVDLANFELLFQKTFHAKAHLPLPIEEFALIQELGDCQFKFGESVGLFESSYLVYDIWQLRKDPNPPETLMNFYKSSYLVLYKGKSESGNEIYIKSIPLEEYNWLQLLFSGKSLESLFHQAQVDFPLSQERIQELFQFLSTSGVIESIDFPGSDQN